MKTTSFSSLLSAVFHRRSLSDEAQVFAEAFCLVPGLAEWVLKQGDLAPSARRSALMRCARFFRSENVDLGVAEKLEQLADNGLFELVASRLHRTTALASTAVVHA